MSEVVNIRTDIYDILIARPSKWGNKYIIGRDGTREECIKLYRIDTNNNPLLLSQIPELIGKRLGCYCKPKACHGDVLLELIEEYLNGDDEL